MTVWNDTHTFEKPVVFSAEVTFSETPPEISLDNLTSLTGTGTCTFADLAATDDLSVGDDASIGGDLAVTGNATIGGTLGITGATTCAALTASGTVTTSGTLDCNGAVDLSGATLTLPANTALVKRYVSNAVATSGLTGTSTVSFDLTGEPTNYIPVAAYILITGTPTGDTEAVDTLTCTVGPTGTPTLYSIGNIFDQTSRVKASEPGPRANDALKLFLTAKLTDSAANLNLITGLTSIRFVLHYLDIVSET